MSIYLNSVCMCVPHYMPQFWTKSNGLIGLKFGGWISQTLRNLLFLYFLALIGRKHIKKL